MIALTVKQYNNTALCDDLEMAAWLLRDLRADWEVLQAKLEHIHRCYGGVPQGLCDDVQQLYEDGLDALCKVDPACLAEEARRAELHDRYVEHIHYAADSIQGGHC